MAATYVPFLLTTGLALVAAGLFLHGKAATDTVVTELWVAAEMTGQPKTCGGEPHVFYLFSTSH